MKAFSTRLFSYAADTRTFAGEISTLGCTVADLEEGFMLISQRTGATVKYFYVDTVRDAEGDVQYWTFREEQTRNNHCTRINLFND